MTCCKEIQIPQCAIMLSRIVNQSESSMIQCCRKANILMDIHSNTPKTRVTFGWLYIYHYVRFDECVNRLYIARLIHRLRLRPGSSACLMSRSLASFRLNFIYIVTIETMYYNHAHCYFGPVDTRLIQNVQITYYYPGIITFTKA